jgi:hypothetical protein
VYFQCELLINFKFCTQAILSAKYSYLVLCCIMQFFLLQIVSFRGSNQISLELLNILYIIGKFINNAAAIIYARNYLFYN